MAKSAALPSAGRWRLKTDAGRAADFTGAVAGTPRYAPLNGAMGPAPM